MAKKVINEEEVKLKKYIDGELSYNDAEFSDLVLKCSEYRFIRDNKLFISEFFGATEMLFESTIFDIAGNIEQMSRKEKSIKSAPMLRLAIIQIIEEPKYKGGRCMFARLVGEFKIVEYADKLATFLNDKSIRTGVIYALRKLNNMKYIDEVRRIYAEERDSWNRKESKKYIEKYEKSIKVAASLLP